MPQTTSEDLFEVGHALVIVCEYFVEQTNRVVGSHDWGEDYRYLLFLVGLIKMFYIGFNNTLDIDKIIQGLLKCELLNKESLLLLRHLLEEILQITVPNLSNFSEEWLSNWLATHVCKYLSH